MNNKLIKRIFIFIAMFSFLFLIACGEKKISSIEVKEYGKTEYKVGEEFDTTGFKLQVNYDDKETKDVDLTSEMVDIKTFENAGNQKITVTYTEKEDSAKTEIEVTVTDSQKSIKEIEIKTLGKKDYYVGDSFLTDGYVILVKYTDETTTDVLLTNEMIDAPSKFDSTGTLTINVVYQNDYKCSFTVLVTTKELIPVKFELKEKGETIICSGTFLKAEGFIGIVTYNDESTKEVPITEDMFSTTTFEENFTDDEVKYNVSIYYIEGETKLETAVEISLLAEWDYEEYYGKQRDALMIDQIYERVSEMIPEETQSNIELLSSSDYKYEFTLLWKSSNDVVLSPSGIVEPVEDNVEVELYLTIKGYYEVKEYTFTITITGLGPIIMPEWNKDEKHVFAYFYEGTSSKLDPNDASKIDVVNYCFARVSGTSISVDGLSNLKENLKLRRTHGLRFVLSIGGGGSGSLGFSNACYTDDNRAKFVQSIMDVIKQYGFDGIDLDWEYPSWTGLSDSQPDDKLKFTLLCKELREAMDNYKEGLLLTSAFIAANSAASLSRFYEAAELNKYLDYVHIMTYDLNLGGIASHLCNVLDGGNAYSAEKSVVSFHEAGFDYDKLVVGSAFYGKIATLTTPTTATADVYRKPISDIATISFTRIYNEYLFNSSFKKFYDTANGAYYLTDGKVFITYEDPDIIKVRCALVEKYDIQGIMFWDYGSDATGTLLGLVKSGIYEINNRSK